MLDDIINKYREKSLQIDFQEITLSQLGTGGNKEHQGPGYIYQNENGALSFKLFCDSSIDLPYLFQNTDIKTGELIPDENYYRFEGTDMKGRKWKSPKVDVDSHSNPDFSTFSGTLPEIYLHPYPNDNRDKEGSHHRLWIPREIDIPTNSLKRLKHFIDDEEINTSCNRSASKFETDDYRILLLQDEGWLNIEISIKHDDFHPFALKRFTGALQFILGEHLDYVMYLKSNNQDYTLTFRPFQDKPDSSTFSEPYLFKTKAEKGTSWQLFAKYLQYTLNDIENSTHPITQIVANCISAGEGNFDAYSLTLALSVEEILNKCFQELEVDDNIQPQDIAKVKATIESIDIDSNLNNRILGFLNYVQKTNATE